MDVCTPARGVAGLVDGRAATRDSHDANQGSLSGFAAAANTCAHRLTW